MVNTIQSERSHRLRIVMWRLQCLIPQSKRIRHPRDDYQLTNQSTVLRWLTVHMELTVDSLTVLLSVALVLRLPKTRFLMYRFFSIVFSFGSIVLMRIIDYDWLLFWLSSVSS